MNKPEDYLEGAERSRFLVDLVRTYARPEWRILEIGCNIGRNLQHLFLAGFSNLEGIEISEEAVRQLRAAFPKMAQHANIRVAPAEEALPSLEDKSFGLVFTMAVLEHIHAESEWLFAHIVRITGKILITIEDEKNVSERHFPRNYQRVFEKLGMRQVHKVGGRKIEGLRNRSFVARVFERP